MDQAYWLERERVSIAHARAATLPDVRLIHYDLAHRSASRPPAPERSRDRSRPSSRGTDASSLELRPTPSERQPRKQRATSNQRNSFVRTTKIVFDLWL